VKHRLTWNQFCRVVREAVESLPPPFQPYLENVVVDVRESPKPENLDAAAMDGDQPGDRLIFGEIDGESITEQEAGVAYPTVITIFRRPHEELCRTRAELLRQIRATVIHELAHHFGFEEEDLDDFERLHQ
jgi:predicted Zn-dependent protease with MMP-like domain